LAVSPVASIAPAPTSAFAPTPLPASTSRRSTPGAPARALSEKGPARQADVPAETPGGSGDRFSGATGATTEVAEARVAPIAAPAPPPSAPPSAVAPPPAPAPPTPASDSVSEIRGVALARNLVDSDPEAALSLLEKVRRDHPNGYFVEERQALTVIALARLGRESAVRQQAAAFLRAYPNGPFSDRVRSVAAAAR
ncbi:MAG TPA: hypothetical protein VII82_08810, partial [Polyangiaceae bacterium]